MIRYLKNRFRAYVRSIAAEVAVQPDILDLASKVQLQMDTDPIAERVVDLIKRTDHAVEYESLAECISLEELAQQFDTRDLAGEMDYSSLAGEVHIPYLAQEFDVSDIAAEIDASEVASAFDEDSIADRVVEDLDYKCLAAAILKELRPVEVRPSA
jgi:hypothetical protein